MSALRDEIRAILREEIAALRSEAGAEQPGPVAERVRITSSAELTRFAQDILRRASEPGFADRVARGELVFELGRPPAALPSQPTGRPIVTGPGRKVPERLEKALITERDINALDGSSKKLRIAPTSRLTPLARDEARSRGIRVERDKA